MSFVSETVGHTLELPKYEPPSNNTTALGPLEKWLYFLKHAEHLDADDLAEQLVDDEFREAAGVLTMISQSPEDRQFYEARMKFLHDEEARLMAAREEGREGGREEGREEGIARGTLIGKIQSLQEVVGDAVTNAADLQRLSSDALADLLAALQERLRSRGE